MPGTTEAANLFSARGRSSGQNSQDMLSPLHGWKERNFAEEIATRTIPVDQPGVDADGFGKRLVAFGVGHVDRLPGRQDEHRRMKGVCGEHRFQLACR